MGRDTEEIRAELARYSRLAYARGLSSGVSGNLSARVPGTETALIKKTGVCFAEADPADFILVDLQGRPLEDGRPSKEVRFHCGIYRARPEIGGICHGHSAYATAYATARGDLPPVTAASQGLLKEIGVVGVAPSGSEALADMVVAVFRGSAVVACVLQTHGFVTAGADLSKAYYAADVLEDNAKVAWLMAAL
ncbi:MAG: class II aldolase/adducin family protein [Gracilibacteraceae bacterium]|jgi:L-fuculose-phosphate aldolase|nr:class II aldolase/adducin family protein [Gracilibacteraceae bacterium]